MTTDNPDHPASAENEERDAAQVQRVLDHLLWLTNAVLSDPETHHHFDLTAFEIEVLRIKECGMNLSEDVDKAEICMESALAMERASDAWQRGNKRRGLLMQLLMKLKALSINLQSGAMRQATVSTQMIAEWQEVIEDKVFTGEMSEYVRILVATIEDCLRQLPEELKQYSTKGYEVGVNAEVGNA